MPPVRPTLRAAAVLLYAAAWAACRPSAPSPESKAGAQSAASPAAVAAKPSLTVGAGDAGWCGAEHEAEALRCAHGRAWRSGDTLHVRLASGGVQTYVTRPSREDTDDGIEWRYVGALAGRAGDHHVLRRLYVDGTSPSIVLVVGRSGRSVPLVATPLPSPDGEHFAAASSHLDDCEYTTRIQLWRMTDSLPVREVELEPYRCERRRGWAPSDLAWQGPDTLRFVAREVLADDVEPPRAHRALLVRTANGWDFVGIPEPKNDSDEET